MILTVHQLSIINYQKYLAVEHYIYYCWKFASEINFHCGGISLLKCITSNQIHFYKRFLFHYTLTLIFAPVMHLVKSNISTIVLL